MAAQAPPAIADSGVETETHHDGQSDATEAVGEKPIVPILPASSFVQKNDGSGTVNQPDTEIATKTIGSVAGMGSVSPGNVNNAEIVATVIPANSRTVTAVTVTTAANSVANPETVTGVIAANGNEAVDEVHPENNDQHGNVLHGVEAPVGSGEPDTGAKTEETDEEPLPPEVDGVQVPPHWHPRPCVHITSIGGQMREEELLSLFTVYGQVSSISFENERRDSAIIRYEHSSGDADVLVVHVREALNNTKLGDRTLIVEPYRPDSLLFVGNLTPDIDDALLRKMFEPHGRIERAFVLRNAEGWSKGYGFVEYSLKGQASSAKLAMGNINMDGRVLRVEWSDCRRVVDMFSTVLFVDRIPRDNPNVELSLRNLFGLYGKVRDCYVAIGIHQHFRGFAFIDFYHSIYADRAHRGLDGHELEGSNIRVSFANPSKSAQSYKLRFGSTPSQAALSFFGRGALDHTLQPLVPGMLMGASLRGSMAMPLLASRLMGSGRPGMLGMGIGMQFGRGALDRGIVSPILGGGSGMLTPGSMAAGMIGRPPIMMGNVATRPRMAAGGNLLQVGSSGFSAGQGAIPITSTAIVQVATAQAKAREEEAKARAEALKQSLMKPVTSDQQSTDQYRFNTAQQNYYQQQTSASTDQQYKQADPLYSYQQPAQQQNTYQAQYQAWMQAGQQTQQTYTSQYYSQPSQNYMQQQQQQQQQTAQYTQHDGYYQQSTQQAQAIGTQQQYGYAQQYSQQYGQQYSQQPSQNYGQMYGQVAQTNGQQYQQAVQQQPQAAYTQQNYTEQYPQQQPTQEQGQVTVASVSTAGSVALDPSQQQAYAAYYQQQAQVQSGTATAAASTTATTQQSYEAQWAAYYASQAAYQQQQASTTDVGQKRTADQMESSSQNQAAYNYAQIVPSASGYMQQAATGTSPYQQQPATSTSAYQQQVAPAMAGYQQPGTYQQPVSSGPGYHQPTVTSSTGYDLSVASATDGYQQQAAAAAGTFQAAAQGQTAAAGMYDYSKRPKY